VDDGEDTGFLLWRAVYRGVEKPRGGFQTVKDASCEITVLD